MHHSCDQNGQSSSLLERSRSSNDQALPCDWRWINDRYGTITSDVRSAGAKMDEDGHVAGFDTKVARRADPTQAPQDRCCAICGFRALNHLRFLMHQLSTYALHRPFLLSCDISRCLLCTTAHVMSADAKGSMHVCPCCSCPRMPFRVISCCRVHDRLQCWALRQHSRPVQGCREIHTLTCLQQRFSGALCRVIAAVVCMTSFRCWALYMSADADGSMI